MEVGPAAKKLGYDVQAYIDEFLDIESDLGIGCMNV